MIDDMRRVFQTLTYAEADLLWKVLSAYVENEQCNSETENAGDPLAEALLKTLETALVKGI